jgi:hypothetical protein
VSALATDSPGASLLICFVAIFFTFFLLIALVVVSVPASAVPASAATSASAATMIAGDGSEVLLSPMVPLPA